MVLADERGSGVLVSEPNRFRLPPPGVVDVWWFPFVEFPGWEELARGDLSEVELARAAQLKIEERRRRFLFYRWAIRRGLAQYAGITPQAVPLGVLPSGKPYWMEPIHGVQLSFNHAHTKQLGVLAVTSTGEVGIDVEQATTEMKYGALATEALSEVEARVFATLPDLLQAEYVLRHWTCKEAFLKGLAIGLAVSPANVTIKGIDSVEPQVLCDLADCRPTEWQMSSWSPQPACWAAVAYRGAGRLVIVQRNLPLP
jgi:4'-phosphopantetheinyl transferase